MSTPNPYAPPQATVQDIPDPSITTIPADRLTRFVAAILDGIIASIFVWLPLILGGGLGALFDPVAMRFNAAAFASGAGLFALAGLIAWAWITIVLVKRNGQTIAKKMLGIKVVRTDGSPISLGRIFWLRNVLNTVLSIIPFYGLVDALLIFGEQRRCIHDMIADTIVIKA